MPIPEALAITGTTLSLATNAFKVCQSAYDIFQAAKNAPRQIQRLSTDIQGIYQVLGLLQTTLNAEEIINASLPRQMIADLELLLRTCTRLCVDVIIVMKGFITGTDGMAKRGIWKSLHMACTSLMFVTGSHTQVIVEQIQRDVTNLRRHAENQERSEIKESLQGNGEGFEHETLTTNAAHRISLALYNLPLKRFMWETMSMVRGKSTLSESLIMFADTSDQGDYGSADGNMPDSSSILAEVFFKSQRCALVLVVSAIGVKSYNSQIYGSEA